MHRAVTANIYSDSNPIGTSSNTSTELTYRPDDRFCMSMQMAPTRIQKICSPMRQLALPNGGYSLIAPSVAAAHHL